MPARRLAAGATANFDFEEKKHNSPSMPARRLAAGLVLAKLLGTCSLDESLLCYLICVLVQVYILDKRIFN
jgi:hypothetical protein